MYSFTLLIFEYDDISPNTEAINALTCLLNGKLVPGQQGAWWRHGCPRFRMWRCCWSRLVVISDGYPLCQFWRQWCRGPKSIGPTRRNRKASPPEAFGTTWIKINCQIRNRRTPATRSRVLISFHWCSATVWRTRNDNPRLKIYYLLCDMMYQRARLITIITFADI